MSKVNKFVYKGFVTLPDIYNVKDVKSNAAINMKYMLARTRRMFKWKNLPDTIPERDLELMIQANGHACIAEHEGKLYAFTGSFGGEPNAYYLPTKYIVANPYLKFSKEFTIGVDCVIIKNDSLYMGLLPMLSKYCNLIANAELTMDMITILSRAALVMNSEDEDEYKSAEAFVKSLYDGDLGIITRQSLIKGIDVQPGATPSAGVITNLIEAIQYWKASQFNEMGLNANWNAKRETLTSSETLLNSDTLLPFCDDMLFCRQESLDDIKEMFGIELSVDYDSAWETNMKEIELTEEQMEAGLEVTKEQKENAAGGTEDVVDKETTEDTE